MKKKRTWKRELLQPTIDWTLALLVLAGTAGCYQGTRRFPLADPLWVDKDDRPITEAPAKYYSGLYADGADNLVFRPLAGMFAFPNAGEATNVNALDEVPNSSWFTNRIGFLEISDEALARGACSELSLDPASGPWTVTAAKPDGANPGFFISAPQGTFLLKFDGSEQPERATAADVIGSKIYHAAGYNVPCNDIVYFRREILHIHPDATATNQYGEKAAITPADVDKVLAAAARTKDGRLRASASRLVPGQPLGPFRYEGTRHDDPNDIIPHEDRRELRGARLLAAWINHFDAREQNSLDVLVTDNGRKHVRHYYIDFGDSFGSRWNWEPLARRIGHSYYLDFGQLGTDFITLGTLDRPWYRAETRPGASIFGYYNTQDFVPSRWKPGYPNLAFERMSYRDALWMVRILSRFTDDRIRVLVSTGKLTSSKAEAYLVKTLIGRRDQILAEYLKQYAPLDRFRLVRRTPGDLTQSLCFEDLAVRGNIVGGPATEYKMEFYGGPDLSRRLGWLQFQPDPAHPHRSCVVLPIGDTRPADLAAPDAPPNNPLRYGLLKIFINQNPHTWRPTSCLWVHLYDLGSEQGYRIVGLEHQPKPVTPDLYQS
jgi:hypothetical protein